MDTIPKDPYLEFYPDTLQVVRKEFNVHQPGAIEEMIRTFEEWIQKQSHLIQKNFTKHFLEASIILSKGSLEKAKNALDKLCTLKTLTPNFFSKHDVRNELIDLSPYLMTLILPKMTDDHYRIFMIKTVSTDIDKATFFEHYRFVSLICEYMKAYDYTKGITVIIDVRGLNVVALAMKLNVMDLRHLMSVLMEGYGMRMKAIHFLSESKAIDTLVAVMKQVLSEKVGGRIKVHKNIESLHDDVPRDTLPEDYGGKEKPFKDIYDRFKDVLSTKENVEYFREICRPGTDENHRHAVKFNNEILGMPGSFRALQVD